MNLLIDIVIIVLLASLIVLAIITLMKPSTSVTAKQFEQLKRDVFDELRNSRNELNTTVSASISSFSKSQEQIANAQNIRLKELSEQLSNGQMILQTTVSTQLKQLDASFKAFSLENEQKLDNIRTTMENRLLSLQEDNAKKLEKMRETVDEKLQKTLDDKLKQSFSLVSERLEQVYAGLGEMKTLANGVGDLKKVLSNVKTRGILGEIQLGAILEEMLSPEQYVENVATKKGSSDRVEFAIKLPGDGETPVYLPIDAKFPADAYANLIDAYDTGIAENVDAAAALLDKRIKSFAKDIRDKYISVPDTTDFAIMFLPTEGLYAEVVRRGMIEKLQSDYKVNIAGPTTMAALLNSLQMGFKTLAIQKRSSEVWNVLGGVKSEFDIFAKALAQTQNRIKQAGDELETLVGVRTRQMQRKLKEVQTLPVEKSLKTEDFSDEFLPNDEVLT